MTSAPESTTSTGLPPALASALVRAQASTAKVAKAAYDKHSKYWYASADAVVDVARGVLSSVGLACISTGWSVHEQGVTVSYVLMHEAGASLDISATTPCVDTRMGAAKALYASITENLAYVLRGLLLLPRVDELDDGGAPAEPARAAQPQPAPHVEEPPRAPDSTTTASEIDALFAQACADMAGAASPEAIGAIYGSYADQLPPGSVTALRVAGALRGFALAGSVAELDAWIPRIQRWELPSPENDALRAAWEAREVALLAGAPSPADTFSGEDIPF